MKDNYNYQSYQYPDQGYFIFVCPWGDQAKTSVAAIKKSAKLMSPSGDQTNCQGGVINISETRETREKFHPWLQLSSEVLKCFRKLGTH